MRGPIYSNLFRGNARAILARDYGYKPLFNNGVSLTTGFCDVDRKRVVHNIRGVQRDPPLGIEGIRSRKGDRVWSD